MKNNEQFKSELKVYSWGIWVSVVGLVISLVSGSLLGFFGFMTALLSQFGSRWLFVRWHRAGRPEDSQSLF